MIVRVQKHTSRYTVIDNTGLNDSRLSWKARGLLAHLLTKPDNWEVSVSALINAGNEGREAIQTALKELERYGYAQYLPVKDPNSTRLIGRRWVVFERPESQNEEIEVKDSRKTGFPINGFSENRETPKIGKPRKSGNPQQVSTYLVVSTEEQLSTNAAARAKKNAADSEQKGVEPKSPPSCARPPRISFAQAGIDRAEFRSQMLERFPETSSIDIDYYFGRCESWSSGPSQGLSADWVQTAYNFIRNDSSKGKQITLQPITKHEQPSLTDSIRANAIRRAQRYLESIGYDPNAGGTGPAN